MKKQDRQWEVKVSWSWGSRHRFREEFTLRFHGDRPSDAEIEKRIGLQWENIESRYRYDCSRVSYRMYPSVTCAEIREVHQPEAVDIDLGQFKSTYDRPDDVKLFESVRERYPDKNEHEVEFMLRKG